MKIEELFSVLHDDGYINIVSPHGETGIMPLKELKRKFPNIGKNTIVTEIISMNQLRPKADFSEMINNWLYIGISYVAKK